MSEEPESPASVEENDVDNMAQNIPFDPHAKPAASKSEAPTPEKTEEDKPAESDSEAHAQAKNDAQMVADLQNRPKLRTAGQIIALGFAEMVGATATGQERRKLRGAKIEAGRAKVVKTLQKRTREKQMDRAANAYHKAAVAEYALETQLAAHQKRYGAFAAEINANMQKPDILALPESQRRERAIDKAFNTHPEFSETGAGEKYLQDRTALLQRAQDYKVGLQSLSDNHLGVMQAEPKLQEATSALLERAQSDDNLFEQASRAPTIDGEEDESFKKKMQEMWEEVSEAVSKFLEELMDKVLGRTSEGPSGP
jgi:hypothetical protein